MEGIKQTIGIIGSYCIEVGRIEITDTKIQLTIDSQGGKKIFLLDEMNVDEEWFKTLVDIYFKTQPLRMKLPESWNAVDIDFKYITNTVNFYKPCVVRNKQILEEKQRAEKGCCHCHKHIA